MAHKPDDDSHLSEEGRRTQTLREKIEADGRLKAANAMKEGFSRFDNLMTDSAAWKALDSYGRDAYFWIERRRRQPKKGSDNGYNNGRIPMSVRDLASKMRASEDTANRALHRLQALGLIARTRKGIWRGRESKGEAALWRLTAHRTAEGPATHDYVNLGMVEASQLFKEAGEPDPKRLPPWRRKKSSPSAVSGRNVRSERIGTSAQNGFAPNSVHGNEHLTSAVSGHSAGLPGDGGFSPVPAARRRPQACDLPEPIDTRQLLREIRQLQTEQSLLARQAGRQQQQSNVNKLSRETISLFERTERKRKKARKSILAEIERGN